MKKVVIGANVGCEALVRPGRPRKAEADKNSKKFVFYTPAREALELAARARSAGMEVSAYIRSLVCAEINSIE